MRQNLLLLMIALTAVGALSESAVAQPKQLAPGVLKVIPANIDSRDSYSVPMPVEKLQPEIYTPNYAPVLETLKGQTKNVIFYRDVWQYEFSFTGLRQIELPLATADGREGSGNVWYMVYRLRNTGRNISYNKVKEDERFDRQKDQVQFNREDFQIDSKFIPHFYLNGWVKDDSDDGYTEVSYRDQTDPEALRLIRLREDRNRVLLDKVEMMSAVIPKVKNAADDGVWGVAIWRNVDPRVDFVNVNITGLTNAYRIENTEPGERKIRRRTLQLNFWRPGDRVRQAQDKVIYGIQLVDDPVRQIEICDRYRLPGPLLRGFVVSQSADQDILVVEMDAEIQLSTLKSLITPVLDQGKIPDKIRTAFQAAGIQVAANSKVTMDIPQQKWSLTGQMGDQKVSLILRVEPQYWQPAGEEKIRFINGLDFLWKYR